MVLKKDDPQPKTVQQVTQQGQIQHVDSNPSWPLPSQQLAGPCGPKGCAPPRVHNGSTPTSPCRDFQWKMVPPRSLLGTFSVHPFDVHLGGMTQVQGDTATHISGQPTPHRELSTGYQESGLHEGPSAHACWLYHQCENQTCLHHLVYKGFFL